MAQLWLVYSLVVEIVKFRSSVGVSHTEESTGSNPDSGISFNEYAYSSNSENKVLTPPPLVTWLMHSPISESREGEGLMGWLSGYLTWVY